MTMNWNRTIAAAAVLLVSALGVNAQTPDTVFLEELTWVEVREMIDNGKTVVIIPTGGTEQNGPHMFLGKHNYIIRHTAEQMARRLGNALVAPVLQYVPEGDYNREGFGEKPGVITNPAPTFTKVLESAARSLQAHGFKDILIIGDSGGNQGGMEAAADNVNADWSGTGSRVFALRDYYAVGRDNYRAWMLAQFGYGPETVGGTPAFQTHRRCLPSTPMESAWRRGLRWAGPRIPECRAIQRKRRPTSAAWDWSSR